MDTKYYFLTSLFPNEIYQNIIESSKGAIANANNEFQWSLVSGLIKYCANISLINFPNVGAYPLKYKYPYMNGSDISNQEKKIGHSYSFINIIYIKHFLKYLKILQVLKNEISSSNKLQEHVIFVYDLYPPFLKALTVIKDNYTDRDIHICLVVPDINGMTGNKRNIFSDYIFRRDCKTISSAYEKVDSFVLLSKHMTDFVPVGNKPWTVVEGVLNIDKIKKIDKKISDVALLKNIQLDKNHNKIFYSGAIDERNGVLSLMESFKLITNKDFKLIICGDGPLRSLVEKYAREDKRVIYLGQLPNEYIISLQSKVDLLVNPRLPGQVFTKYSFPSKTIEYFSSGTPTLMYRLEGVPEEYFNHCFVVENKDNMPVAEGLKQKIIEIFELSEAFRNNIANSAKDFVINSKSSDYQCKKIFELVSR